MFSWSSFGLRWVACRMAFWTWCSSRRESIQFELAIDLILPLRVGRAAHQLFFVDVTVFMREQSEKREVRKSSTTTEQETTPKSWSQTVQTTRLGCQTDPSKLHTPPAARAMINSPIDREQKLQFSVCKTTRRFAWPSVLSCVLKPSFTKICIRISLCKTSLFSGPYLLSGGMIRRRQKSCKEGVCSIQCFPHTTRCCACFSDYVHTSRIQGYLYSGGGGYLLSGHCNQQQISVKTEGYLFSEGYLFMGFYGSLKGGVLP